MEKYILDKYQFEIIYDSIHMRSTTTKIIVSHTCVCDDFREAWDEVLEMAFKCSLPKDYELVTIHFTGVLGRL